MIALLSNLIARGSFDFTRIRARECRSYETADLSVPAPHAWRSSPLMRARVNESSGLERGHGNETGGPKAACREERFDSCAYDPRRFMSYS